MGKHKDTPQKKAAREFASQWADALGWDEQDVRRREAAKEFTNLDSQVLSALRRDLLLYLANISPDDAAKSLKPKTSAAPRFNDPELHETTGKLAIRCAHCDLYQFMAKNKTCTRCHRPLYGSGSDGAENQSRSIIAGWGFEEETPQAILSLQKALRVIWSREVPLPEKQTCADLLLKVATQRPGRASVIAPLPFGKLLFPANNLPGQILVGILENWTDMAVCGNPGCTEPFFLAKRSSQVYCERGECTRYAQRQKSKKWWNENRGKKVTAKRRKHAKRSNRPN
jgi:hypothetical protein